MIRGSPLATIAVLALLILATGIVSAAPQQQTVVNICSRTPEVQSAILNRVSGATCSTVTDTQLAGITSLNIGGHSNVSFVSGDFAGLTNLNQLSLSDNSLMTLEADLFDGLTNLTSLNLGRNNLMTLEADLFDGLTNMTFLYLADNNLTTLPEDLFDGLTSLNRLGLAKNNLMTLDEDLFDGLTSLNRLGLAENSLMTLEADLFDGLTNLNVLYLNNNNFMTLDENLFDGLTSLASLSLSENSLTTLEADLFDGLTSLNSLGLGGNNLTTLDEDLFDGLTNLTLLGLGGNNLTTLDEDLFDGLTNLTLLRLTGNNLMTLEAGLFDGLTNLNELYLGYNNFMTLEAGLFDGLTNLNNLYLWYNNFMTLEADLFDGLTNLNELYLDNNSLMTLEADLFDGLTNLRRIDLYNNSLMTLEADLFDGLTNLQSIELNNNSLMTLEADLFDGLTNLLFIELNNNSLMTLEADLFDGLTKLDQLLLNNNNLMTLEADLFDGLTNLYSIDLSSNSLMTLEADLFDGLTGLRNLKLQCNSLTALNLDLFDPVATTLSFLDISGNDFATPPTEMDIRAKITSLMALTAGDNIMCKRVTVMFGAADHTVPEGATVEVTVSLSADPERTVTIPLTATGQNGADTADYSVPTGVTFNAGDMEQTITFSATQDTVDDDDESVLLAFDTLPSGVSAGTPIQVTFNITDDDDPQVTVQFGATDYTVPEGDTVEVTVSLSADPERTVTIPLTATNQGEADPADYSVPTGVTFNAGDTEQTITFSATQDTVDDDDESVLLAFDTLPSGVSAGTPNQVTFNITDDDDPQVTVQFGATDYTVPEGDTVEVTVSLSADPERTVTIPLTATGQNGADTADYSVPTDVTFNAGDTEQTITFNATQDNVDDDGESVLLAFDTLPSGVSAGMPNQVTFNITDDDDPQVTVMFGAADYTVPEGDTVEVTVSLSADPERTVTIPLTATNQGEAGPADYSIPTSTTFNAGQTSQTFTFMATQDEVDDDNERVLLTFRDLPERVTQGTPNETTVNIQDDDDPHVAVMFGQPAYSVTEGNTITVRVTLSADPERTVIIPITVMNQNGASSDDYSSLPSSITINANETSKTIEFMATEDETPDRGESVLLSIGTNLPARVTKGTPVETTVTINQAAGQFSLDCSLPAAVWCAELEFSQDIALNWGWIYLRHSDGWDPLSRLSNKNFHFRDMNYDTGNMELKPGTHPVMPNTWSKFHQGFSSFRMQVYQSRGPRLGPSETHYRDWVLHLDGLQIPFKDALQFENQFTWVTPDIQEAFENWSPSTATLIGIEEVPDANQGTNPLLPWAPMQVDASPEGPNRLRIDWAKPAWYNPGLPNPTEYIVQWKPASENWSNSAAVAQQEIRAESHFHHLIVDGLTEGSLYSVRVIASNNAGDGPPSLETIGQPHGNNTALTARTINENTLTLHFSERLDPNSVPKTTDFVVMMDGGLLEVNSVAIIGNEVVLTLNQSVTAANSVLARYEKPTDPAAVFLQDTQGKHVQIPRRLGLLSVHNATPQSSVQPLTATFQNVPASHDGETTLTLDIEFSELVWVGSGLSRDGMLQVTGGTVISAPWRNNRTDGITIHIRPDTSGDILIVLPANRVCDGIISSGAPMRNAAPGAPCAIGNRMLTNESTAKITGPLSPALQVVENTPAEGEPRIDGIPKVGQTLSADTTAIEDVDGLENVVFQYQWLADDTDIADADASSYTTGSGEVGKSIRVRVSFTDDGGNEETLTSAPIVVAAEDLQLRSATVDSGTLTLTYREELENGLTLETTPFAVNVNGSSRSLSGVAVGQFNVLLLLSPAVDAGDTVTVDYTVPDGPNFIRDTLGRKAASFSRQEVTNNTASAKDSKKSQPKDTSNRLTATARGVPTSHDGSTVFTFELEFSEETDLSYRTLRDHGFTVTGGSVTYVSRLKPPSNIGWKIHVMPDGNGDVKLSLRSTTDCSAQGAICTQDGGKLSGGPLTSVPGPNTPATGTPTISGAAQVGETLTADTTGIADEDGLDNATFAYRWTAGGAEIEGATSSSYTLTGDDKGKTIRVQVNFTDDRGNDETLTSAATDSVVAAAPPANTPSTGLPTIAGTAQVGETLTADTSGIEDEDGLNNAAFAYQWLADDAEINGATVSTYTLTGDDEGKAIKVRVSFTDDTGNDEILTSAPTGAVATKPNTQATGTPTINGTAQVGETLTADTSGIEDDDGLDAVTFNFQWLAGGTDIRGATRSSHTIAEADEGLVIQVRVTFTDDAGNDEMLTSTATAAVTPKPNTPATGQPSITGTAQVGETLTAETSDISDTDGLHDASFAYQWLAGGADIHGATGSTYTLTEDEEGLIVQVRLTFTDDAGHSETLTSQGTESVASSEPESPVEPPPAPQNLVGTVNSDGSVTLTWDAPDDGSITGYQILRRRPTEGENTLLVYVADTKSTATTYTDTNVTAGVQHAYRVKAINAAGAGPVSNFVNVTP